ncbi:MAG: penicillin-binding protein 2 [Chloroflexota bacterium]|jgi:penicillin-binding protein 2|nr:penicillin-binding protein 2 [Chloroflexota bacterium]
MTAFADDTLSGPDAEYTPSRVRAGLIRAGILLAFAALTLQLWRLQIVDNHQYATAANANRARLAAITPPRGVIYDRTHNLLAMNSPTFAVAVTEADLPPDRRAQVLQQTADILGVSVDSIEATIRKKRGGGAAAFRPISVVENVPRDLALQLEEQSWALPGVSIQVASLRTYAGGSLYSHILGYTSLPSGDEYTQTYEPRGYGIDERVGAAGIESTYESDLHGRPGKSLFEVDAGGRLLRELQQVPAEPGRDVVLTVDGDLQEAVTQVLGNKLQDAGSASAIVMDPRNGEVLSMVSLPSYDANVFSLPGQDSEINALLSDTNLPLFDRAVAGQYAPGSTFKLVTGIGALEERTIDRNTRINCNGGLRIPNPYDPRLSTFLPDWGVLGVLDFTQGLAQSCNVYFYTLGGGYGEIQGLGSDRLGRYALMLGYGAPTGIDLPIEATGQIPDSNWKLARVGEPWLPGDTYNMAIGQGFVLATPLQVATVTNLIAMGGTAFRPHLVREVLDTDGQVVRTVGAQVLRQAAIRPDTLAAMRDGMVAVLDDAKAKPYLVPGVTIAGKTGTAEFPGQRDKNGILPTHGWFTAYAPADNPRVSVTVFLEHGGGPSDAMPVALQILQQYFARESGGSLAADQAGDPHP